MYIPYPHLVFAAAKLTNPIVADVTGQIIQMYGVCADRMCFVR